MVAHAEAHLDHHGEHPPEPHFSSRISPSILGMYLFIGSEIMLFGSFFTAYFFVRVVNGDTWPSLLSSVPKAFPLHLPVYLAFINTLILVTSSFTMHWALRSVKNGNAFGLRAGTRIAGGLLVLGYLVAALAPFIAPYAEDDMDRARFVHPPQPVHFFDGERRWRGPTT